MPTPPPFSAPVALLRMLGAVLWMSAWIPLTLAVALVLLPWRGLRIRLGNAYAKLTFGVGMRMIGARPIIHGAENLTAQRAIFVANHASNTDIWLGAWMCPWGGCGTAKKSVVYVPVFGQIYWLTGHLRIDRGKSAKAKAALARLAETVHRHALSVWFWAEGTRAADGRLQPFKKGFVHMAIATGLPVVPVVIKGAHRHWPARRFVLTPAEIHVEVLPAIDTSSWSADRAGEHAQQLWELFRSELPADQQPAP